MCWEFVPFKMEWFKAVAHDAMMLPWLEARTKDEQEEIQSGSSPPGAFAASASSGSQTQCFPCKGSVAILQSRQA